MFSSTLIINFHFVTGGLPQLRARYKHFSISIYTLRHHTSITFLFAYRHGPVMPFSALPQNVGLRYCSLVKISHDLRCSAGKVKEVLPLNEMHPACSIHDPANFADLQSE